MLRLPHGPIASPQLLALILAAGCSPTTDDGPSPPPSPGLYQDLGDVIGSTPAEPIEDRYFMPASIGSGAAWLDYDGDGDLDLFLVHGARDATFPGGGPWPCRLLRQEIDGAFVDVSAAAGPFPAGLGMGVAAGDADGDGAPDLYLTRYGPDAFFRNQGDGTFRDETSAAGIDNPHWGASALFFDDGLDGDLDLYVTNYVAYDPEIECTDAGGRPDYCGPAFPGVADVLYRNDGSGRFTDASASSGITRAAAPGLGVVSADFGGDPLPDLYVANDGAPNQLWIRRADGTFVNLAMDSGVALNALARSEAGMGIALGDADGDGQGDLFVTHLRGETHTLYIRDGTQFFDQTMAAGLAGPSVPFTGFGTAFLDVDLDGDRDLLTVNGRVARGVRWQDAPTGFWGDYAEADLLFENDGTGRFRDASASAGSTFAEPGAGRGLALGDIDRDGGVDLLVTLAGGGARLLRRRTVDGTWLSVRVRDTPGGSDSLGAEVEARLGNRSLVDWISSAAFLSSHEPQAHFGLGEAARADLLVRWPGGPTLRLARAPAGRLQIFRPPPVEKP